jgi:hypothetical protein
MHFIHRNGNAIAMQALIAFLGFFSTIGIVSMGAAAMPVSLEDR